jgi:hypothetical protein
VGHQQQLAIQQLQVTLPVFMQAVGEGVGLEVHLDHMGQTGLLDSVIKARLGTQV